VLHQVVHCSACNAPVFILPLSPLPQIGDTSADGQAVAESRGKLGPWFWPIAGAGATLACVAVVSLIVIWSLSGPSDTVPRGEAKDIGSRIAAGRKALAEGSFHEAVQHFEAAKSLLDTKSQLLSSADARELNHLHRQASLLDELLSQSLEELLRQAAGLPAGEWQARFDRSYKGWSVVFDGEVRRDAADHYHLNYRLFVRDEPVRLELSDLKLLHALPLRDPQRLMFGARLASIRREKDAVWVVRFQPDSGVLLTDRGAVAACCFQAIDPELELVLHWQEARLADLK